MAHEENEGTGGIPEEGSETALSQDEKKALKKQRKAEKKAAEAEEKAIEKAKAKAENPERGIETMFRSTGKNHIQLSKIADNKANIMLSINALIISVCITGLLPQLGLHPEIRGPLFVLLGVCLVSMVFAILSTVPKVTKGITTRDECDRKEGNLLYFGNFHAMGLEQYEMAMKEMMMDREYLYGSMVRDLYFLGQVLSHKYKLLRVSYLVFMFGIVAAVLYTVWVMETTGHVHT
ncbi:MAG: hypothetical protein IPP83_03045 [Flavobacteriales bacterium]|nr:hypothetical protein [Flavobacteriales bacterium]